MLVDVDIHSLPSGDIGVPHGGAVYVILWAGHQPIAAEYVQPVDGRITRERLETLAREHEWQMQPAEQPASDFRPFASVILCTYRRDTQLQTALGPLVAQEYDNCEIVVVDNAPRQGATCDVVARCARARYVAYLLHIAATDHVYRRPALRDIANWFSYQTTQRLWPQLRRRDPYPAALTLHELAGGFAALARYWLCGLRARRR